MLGKLRKGVGKYEGCGEVGGECGRCWVSVEIGVG